MFKKASTVLAVITLILTAAACNGAGKTEGGGKTASDAPQSEATLVADMSMGEAAGEANGLISRHQHGYEGLITVEVLAEGLSELTGLDFAIKEAVTGKDGVSVDWSPEASFLGGLGNTEQKEEFYVYDTDSLAWFMMDSLRGSIIENFGGQNLEVFYSMDGFKPLVVPGLSYPSEFPLNSPYMGSPFYFAHADGRGDDAAG